MDNKFNVIQEQGDYGIFKPLDDEENKRILAEEQKRKNNDKQNNECNHCSECYRANK